jgi:hypothetical protein
MDELGQTLPRARREDLLVETLGDELLVYDLRTHRVHCLNLPAARAWEFCDGRHTRAALATFLHREFGLPAESGIVDLALATLQKSDLLPETRGVPRISRRSLVRRLALTAGVASLLPTAESARAARSLASCLQAQECVTGVNDCMPCYIPTPAPDAALLRQCERRRCWQGDCRNLQQTDCPDD